MSKLEKYYQVMPENFNDDLADSLMGVFSNLEGVDVIDEIPALKNELWQRGYLIAPRPEQIIERKDMWFVKVEPSLSKIEKEELIPFFEEMQKYNHKVIDNPIDFTKLVQELLFQIPSINVSISFADLEVSNKVSISIDYSTIYIDLYRIK